MTTEKINTAKMTLVNVEGPIEQLDEAVKHYCNLLVFPSDLKDTLHTDDEPNPYEKLLDKMKKIADNSQIVLEHRQIKAVTSDLPEIKAFVESFYTQFTAMQTQLQESFENLAQSENLLVHLTNMQPFGVGFQRLFSSRYIKVRLGRLPKESSAKLQYYSSHVFFFFAFSCDENYIWGAYFTTNEFRDEVDDIFRALFFERVRIPDGLSGTPADALAGVQKKITEQRAAHAKLCEQFNRLMEEDKPRFLRFYNETLFLYRLHETHRFVSVFSDRFYMTGFVSRENMPHLQQAVASLAGLKLELVKTADLGAR